MIFVKRLSKRQLLLKKDSLFWGRVLYKLAIGQFKHVPKSSILELLKYVKKGEAIVFLIHNNNKVVGFAGILIRSVIIKNKKVFYFALDVACLKSDYQRKGIISKLTMKILLFERFLNYKHFSKPLYAAAFCMVPDSFVMLDFPNILPREGKVTLSEKLIYEKIVRDHCREFNLKYPGYGKPIYFSTWIPRKANLRFDKNNLCAKYFFDHNPLWRKGYGLPIVFPVDLKSGMFVLKTLISRFI